MNQYHVCWNSQSRDFRFNQRTYGAGWDEVELIGREESEGGVFLQRKLDPGPYIPYLLVFWFGSPFRTSKPFLLVLDQGND